MAHVATDQFGPYSPVRQAGNYYYISGQVGVDTNKHAGNEIKIQTAQALRNLSAVLNSVHLVPEDIVKTTVFLKNMDDFAAFNEVYLTYFSEPRPARSCVAVASLPHIGDSELLVEIEAIAYKDTSV